MKLDDMTIMKEGPSWGEAYPVLSEVINEKNLKIGAELGVAYGGHAEYILSHTSVEKLYGIDPYAHIIGYDDPMNFSDEKFDLLFKSMLRRLSSFGKRFIAIRKKSKDALSDVPETLDFVYIDADHSYAGVKDDIARWYGKVRRNGIIAGHDYGHPNFPGTTKAVDEFCTQHNWKLTHHHSGVWWVEKNLQPISFIIPAYNCATTIETSVRSILDSNIQEGDEIVIVDDKSTDNTLAVIKQLASNNPIIKIVEQAHNQGGGAARNTAIKNSKNDLIFCLDADNVLARNTIGPLKHLLLSSDSDVASFQTLQFFKKTISTINHRWVFKKSPVELSDVFDSPVVPPASGNYLYTKQSWVRVGGYPEHAGALDAWGFGVQQLATGARMSILPNSYYFHRFGNESYWIRESKKGTISTLATEILYPYKDTLDKNVWNYIETNPTDWFERVGTISFKENSDDIGVLIPPLKKRMAKTIRKIIPAFIKTPIKKLSLYLSFVSDYRSFKKASETSQRFPVAWNDRYPQLYDNTADTNFDAHYLYHPAWAARIIVKNNPSKHVDISSILHFSTLVSAFVPVEFYDYRPAHITLSNLKCGSADLMALPFPDNSVQSISCMHTIEHVGLGRYGDPLDPDGDLKAIKELMRVLAPGGSLLFVTPIGKPLIQFNAHRIYSYEQIISYFPGLKLEEFSLIPDNAINVGIIKNASQELANAQTYGCGCFWFKKPLS